MALTLKWQACGDDHHWCSLANLNLDSIKAKNGVYIIWHEGNPSRIVRIGQGKIADRLGAHRNDATITQYGNLRATWASVPVHQMDGVERYLADTWNPLVGDAFPATGPIAVNSPFG